jgi:hypothetical protein
MHIIGTRSPRLDASGMSRIACVVLLLSSSLFAFYHSDTAYSSDEVWSVAAANRDVASSLEMLKADVHPPLYFLLLHEWVRWVGTGERKVRALSGLFYILTVFAVYAIGRSFYSNDIGFLCAVVYMCSPLAILSAQFARMYALLSLLSLGSSGLYFYLGIDKRRSAWAFAAYVLVNILGTFTHVAFFFVLFSQLVVEFTINSRRFCKGFLLALSLSVLPYVIFWAPILISQIHQSEEGLAWLSKPGLRNMGETVWLFGGAFWILIPLIAFAWWRNGFRTGNLRAQLVHAKVPSALLFLSLAVPFVISQVKPVFNSRFAIIGLPFFALSVGSILIRKISRLFAISLFAISLTMFFIVHDVSSQCDNKMTATYLSKTSRDQDVLIFTSLTRMPIDHYLLQIEPNKNLLETSFPAAIDRHPGYEGGVSTPARLDQLDREAEQLITNVQMMRVSNPGQRVFFISGKHPEIDSMIEQRLMRYYHQVPSESIECDSSPYFRRITVYR